MELVRRHIFITGRVQGVGFRHFARLTARELGIKGWVRNRKDGRVEAVAEGDPENLEQFLARLREGPMPARVERVETMPAEGDGAPFRSFDQKPTA
ncbi:MAG: acylphosphatase [Balneolaceae bacterium]